VRSRTAHEQCIGWVDRPLFSRDGASLVFMYRVGRCKAGGPSWETSSYLFTIGADGSGLWRCALRDGKTTHPYTQMRSCAARPLVPAHKWHSP